MVTLGWHLRARRFFVGQSPPPHVFLSAPGFVSEPLQPGAPSFRATDGDGGAPRPETFAMHCRPTAGACSPPMRLTRILTGGSGRRASLVATPKAGPSFWALANRAGAAAVVGWAFSPRIKREWLALSRAAALASADWRDGEIKLDQRNRSGG